MPLPWLSPRQTVAATALVRHSHIGRQPVKFPHDVSVTTRTLDAPLPSFPTCRSVVVVKGPLGSLQFPLHPGVSVNTTLFDDRPSHVARVRIERPHDQTQRSRWGLTRSHLSNMVEGVSVGWVVPLRISGVGYRAQIENGRLGLKLGYSHPIALDVPEGVEARVPVPTRIVLTGIDLQKVTAFAAAIRRWRPPEPYNLKGVFVGNETIRKKESKQR